MSIKHSILMICYNQEKYIRQALDSVLCELVLPYEIIIGDDFSTDGTRDILKEYKVKYPDIIKLVLNEKNMGIFANLNNITHLPSGDMIHFLAGDDWYKPNFLENVNKKIDEMSLDPHGLRFILLPDVILHNLDATEQILKNDPKLISIYSPAGLVIRDLARWRQVGLSRALFDKWSTFPENSEELGPWSDRMQHVMLAQHIEKQIIMDCQGAVYRVGVGIASKTKQDELELSYCNALKQLIVLNQKGGLIINQVDAYCILFIIKCSELKIKFKLRGFTSAVFDAVGLLNNNLYEFKFVMLQLSGILRRMVSKSSFGILLRRLRRN